MVRTRGRIFFGWWIALASFVILFCILGLGVYGLPLFYDHFVVELGWSRARVTSGNAISRMIIGPLFGFLAGWLIDSYGPKRILLAGCFLMGLTLVGLSRTHSFIPFYFFYFTAALAYVCAGPLPHQVLLSTWFKRKRGKAMGFAYVGIGAGGAAVPLLVYWLTSGYGWRMALEVLGFIIWALTLPIIAVIRTRPSDMDQSVDGDAEPKCDDVISRSGANGFQAPEPASILPVLRTSTFWLLALGSFLSISAIGGVNQHLKLLLRLDVGMNEATVLQTISIVLVASIIGRILMGMLADRFPKKYVMVWTYLLVASAIPILFFVKVGNLRYLFAVLFGFSMGADYLMIPLMAAECFGVRVLGRVMGIVLTADSVGEAVCPWLVGYLRDLTGNYSLGLGMLFVIALLGAVNILLIPHRNGIPLSRLQPSQQARVETPGET